MASNDRHLWDAYDQATSDTDRRLIAGQIVEAHMGFLIEYANRHRQYYWDSTQRAEYVQELVMVALERVPGYDRSRGAAFISYVRPFLQPVKWKMLGACSTIQVGYETARLTIEVNRMVAEGENDPDRLAAHLSRLHGKKIGVGRVRKLLARPRVLSGDKEEADNSYLATRETVPMWETFTVGSVRPVEDEVIAAVDGTADADVAGRLAALDLTGLEHAIVVGRLMAVRADRVTVRDLADAHGTTDADVRATERQLVERLRGLFEDLA